MKGTLQDVELLLTPDELGQVRRAIGVYLEMDRAATVRDPTPLQAGRALAGIVASWLAMVDAQDPQPRPDRRCRHLGRPGVAAAG